MYETPPPVHHRNSSHRRRSMRFPRFGLSARRPGFFNSDGRRTARERQGGLEKGFPPCLLASLSGIQVRRATGDLGNCSLASSPARRGRTRSAGAVPPKLTSLSLASFPQRRQGRKEKRHFSSSPTLIAVLLQFSLRRCSRSPELQMQHGPCRYGRGSYLGEPEVAGRCAARV
jgi:hypothetical protein